MERYDIVDLTGGTDEIFKSVHPMGEHTNADKAQARIAALEAELAEANRRLEVVREAWPAAKEMVMHHWLHEVGENNPYSPPPQFVTELDAALSSVSRENADIPGKEE